MRAGGTGFNWLGVAGSGTISRSMAPLLMAFCLAACDKGQTSQVAPTAASAPNPQAQVDPAVARAAGPAASAAEAPPGARPSITYNEAVYCLALTKYLDGDSATPALQGELDAVAIKTMAAAMKLSDGVTDGKSTKSAADVRSDMYAVLGDLNSESISNELAGTEAADAKERLFKRRLGEFRLMCRG